MSALYLGVVVLPLVVLFWNLGAGGLIRRKWRARSASTPSVSTTPAISRGRRVRGAPRAALTRVWAVLRRRPSGLPAPAVEAAVITPATFEIISPDLPRSPSSPGWVPATGYSALPVADQR